MEPFTTLISPAPRRVPWSVQIHVLFGGHLSRLGWFMLAFGLAMAGYLVGHSDLRSRWELDGPTETVTATVEAVGPSSYSENKRKIVQIDYRYEAHGQAYRGRSYASDVTMKPGCQLPVELLSAEPSVSRLKGYRRHPFSSAVALTMLLPLLGLGLATAGLLFGLRNRRLLREGELAWGELIATEATSARVNKKTVYRLTFRFQDPRSTLPRRTGAPFRVPGAGEAALGDGFGQSYEVVCRTHEPERLMDEKREQLLFDPGSPSRAVLVDSLPGRTTLGADGELTTAVGVIPTLLAPLATAAIIAIGALFLLY